MVLQNLIKWAKPPCGKCPYKLGIVKTLVDPCPECRENGYKTYEIFISSHGEARKEEDK